MSDKTDPTTPTTDPTFPAPDNLNRIPTAEWDSMLWGYNLPLQMWRSDNGGYQCLNYMARKECCKYLGSNVSKEELPTFCDNTAKTLRNLAELFEALGRGEIRNIHYADQTVEEAKASDKEIEESENNNDE